MASSLAERAEGAPVGRGTFRRGVRWRRAAEYLSFAPFAAFVIVFLLWPAYIVVTGAFIDAAGHPSTDAVQAVVTQQAFLDAFGASIRLSAITAVAGAVLGALLSWAVSVGTRSGWLRRGVLAACGVLAQFGGVMLAFAFIATVGNQGLIILILKQVFGENAVSSPIYTVPGLTLVYLYFEIPLMVLTFMPALEALKPAWGEAVATLGGSRWTYWREVGFPILAPAFFGCMILLFANAFSSFATAAALISQGGIWPLDIQRALTSETVVGHENEAGVIALGMIVVMVVLMSAYGVLQRRAARWER